MESITDLIQCSICLETLTDPRMLPCIHTFCLKCLQQTVMKMEEQSSTRKLNCPICRMEFDIPPQGVEGFQKNFFMDRLKEIATITKPSNKSCDICLESQESDQDEVRQADIYCIQCHKNICRRCSKSHKSIADAKNHQLIPLGTELTEDIGLHQTISHQDCPRHENQQTQMYCSECKEVICVVCFAEIHQNHKFSGVEKQGSTFRQQLEEVLSDVEICLNELLRKVKQCTDKKANLQRNVDNLEQTVVDRKNELIAYIDKCAQSLLEELASIRQIQLKVIQNEIEENERQVVIIESFKDYCKQIETKGTTIEFCQVVPALKRRAQEIQQTHRTMFQQSTELFEVHFRQTNFEELLESENAIGRIKVQQSENAIDSIRSRGKLDIPSFSYIHGVTKLDNKIYVLCEKPNVIRIFRDQGTFDLQMEIDIQQIHKPWDVASSEKSKCLYINTEWDTCIWKITPDDRQVTKWLTIRCQGLGRSNLSVTSEGHVLLLAGYPENEVMIYSSDAQLLRRFPLPSNISDPQKIACNKDGEFIVSHREGDRNGHWTISRLTSDGQTVISRFNATDKTQKLGAIHSFALDSDNDRLFLVDNRNDCVILLNPESQNLIKILLIEEKNGMPRKLFYDGKESQLIVAYWSQRVDVYEVT